MLPAPVPIPRCGGRPVSPSASQVSGSTGLVTISSLQSGATLATSGSSPRISSAFPIASSLRSVMPPGIGTEAQTTTTSLPSASARSPARTLTGTCRKAWACIMSSASPSALVRFRPTSTISRATRRSISV